MWFRALVLVLITSWLSPGSASGPTLRSQAYEAVQWPVEVARHLIDEHQFVQLPPKGKTNPKFDKTTRVFSMPLNTSLCRARFFSMPSSSRRAPCPTASSKSKIR